MKQQHDMSPAPHLLLWRSSPLDSICRCYLYVADFILVPCCQNDEVAGMNLKIVSFAVIFATVFADIGILLIALVVRQPCTCKHESGSKTGLHMQLSAEERQVLLLSTARIVLAQMCSLMLVVRQSG